MIGRRFCEQITLTSIGRNNPAQHDSRFLVYEPPSIQLLGQADRSLNDQQRITRCNRQLRVSAAHRTPPSAVLFRLFADQKHLHRIGRTARAGADGISVTFVDWDDLARWKMIDTALTLGLGEPEETYSSSEHLYEMLNIPAGSTGRMVKAKPVSEAPRKEPAKPAKEKPAKEKSEDRTARVRTRTKKFTS